MKPLVALIKGGNRSENIAKSLLLNEGQIDLKNKNNVLIKVNFSSFDNKLGATHVEAVRILLQFLRERYDGNITIGETTTDKNEYEKFGYLELEKEFGVKLVNLKKSEWEFVDVYDSALCPMKLHFSKQVIDSDYRIAIGPAKTHDQVIATLSIKNLAMGGLSGSPAHGDKFKLHQGYPVHNLDLYLLAKRYPPQLSIIDGYIGMEGNGPCGGDPVDWGVAISSCDPVAADSLAAQLMGFKISDIGYLWYCHRKGLGASDIDEMNIIGANPMDC